MPAENKHVPNMPHVCQFDIGTIRSVFQIEEVGNERLQEVHARRKVVQRGM